MTTADWHDGEPESGSLTRHIKSTGGTFARRKVRRDGTVLLKRERWAPSPDAEIQPEPGEWVLVYRYRDGHGVTEWTAPADPDGYIRRLFWRKV